MSKPENRDEHPKTALEEVLHEAARAEKRTTEPARAEERRGEAGDAITPSTRAEEGAQGD